MWVWLCEVPSITDATILIRAANSTINQSSTPKRTHASQRRFYLSVLMKCEHKLTTCLSLSLTRSRCLTRRLRSSSLPRHRKICIFQTVAGCSISFSTPTTHALVDRVQMFKFIRVSNARIAYGRFLCCVFFYHIFIVFVVLYFLLCFEVQASCCVCAHDLFLFLSPSLWEARSLSMCCVCCG